MIIGKGYAARQTVPTIGIYKSREDASFIGSIPAQDAHASTTPPRTEGRLLSVVNRLIRLEAAQRKHFRHQGTHLAAPPRESGVAGETPCSRRCQAARGGG